jgi:YesN/AraC family two-component response regulator
MITLLLVATEKKAFSAISRGLTESKAAAVFQSDSGKEALEVVALQPFDLVITDEKLCDMEGLVFAEKLVKHNPMIHCAVVSTLSDDDFHEASEGLGVLAKLSPCPCLEDGLNLIERVEMIRGQFTS